MDVRSRLGVKFVILTVSILSLTLLLNAAWFMQRQQKLLQEQMQERGRILGQFLSHVSVEAILSFDFVSLESYVRDVSRRQDIVFGMITDKSGTPLTNYYDNDNPYVRSLADGRKFTSINELLEAAHKSPAITLRQFPITERDNLLGHALIGISHKRLEKEMLDNFVTQVLVYSAIIVFLSMAIYLVFRLNVLRPIRLLVNASQRITHGRFDEPVEFTSEDEIGLLTETFNTMMSEVRKDRDLLNFQANYDALTGLPNRMQAIERLSEEISRAKRANACFAVIYIDLDNFKYINDTMGHMLGDELLEALSYRFRSALRESDIIARLGGDEFLLILPTSDRPSQSKEVAYRLIDSLADPIVVSDREVFIRCSMGIAFYPTDGQSAAELMANADNAMYQAKLSHTENICFFAPEMNRTIKERLELEHDLHLALGRNEFVLYYQPIFNAAEHRMIGAEALLRWNHPERGLIHPLVFIPLAESTGRIVSIGEWALDNAMQTTRNLLEQGLNPGFVTVNVSRVQLTQNFEGIVQRTLERANLTPSRLRLEVTESALMEHYGELPDMLRRLDNLGVKLVLDDFGTGFSSLNYLKHFPFHTLKIDKSFIDNVPDNEDDASLVRGIIAMGRSLGLNVVSEGVEREEQNRFLIGSGVELMQGYLFARPMSLEDFTKYLRKHSKDIVDKADGSKITRIH